MSTLWLFWALASACFAIAIKLPAHTVFFCAMGLYYGSGMGMSKILFKAPVWAWYLYFALASVAVGTYTLFYLRSTPGSWACVIAYAMACYTLLTYPGYGWFDKHYDVVLAIANVAFAAAIVIHFLN